MKRGFNIARIRRQVSYEIPEICHLLDVHKNTVREWLRQGLPKTENRRPYLIYGEDLKIFLGARRKARRKSCASNEFYCFRCRLPRRNMGDLADLELRNEKTVMLKGLCETCGTSMHKVQGMSSLPKILQIFDIPTEQLEHIRESVSPSLDCYFRKEA